MDVKDTGVGISDEDKRHLFHLFGKLEKTYHINQQGVGLGLVISKKLCEILGGQITVNSKVGVGSTFTFLVKIDRIKHKRHTSSIPAL